MLHTAGSKIPSVSASTSAMATIRISAPSVSFARKVPTCGLLTQRARAWYAEGRQYSKSALLVFCSSFAPCMIRYDTRGRCVTLKNPGVETCKPDAFLMAFGLQFCFRGTLES
jgi:hypothetical protein